MDYLNFLLLLDIALIFIYISFITIQFLRGKL